MIFFLTFCGEAESVTLCMSGGPSSLDSPSFFLWLLVVFEKKKKSAPIPRYPPWIPAEFTKRNHYKRHALLKDDNEKWQTHHIVSYNLMTNNSCWIFNMALFPSAQLDFVPFKRREEKRRWQKREEETVLERKFQFGNYRFFFAWNLAARLQQPEGQHKKWQKLNKGLCPKLYVTTLPPFPVSHCHSRCCSCFCCCFFCYSGIMTLHCSV